MLFLLMLGGLVLSTSIPKAFESRGLWFAHRLRRDAGRPDALPAGIDAVRPGPGAHECDPHPGLAVGVGGVLDRGGLAEGQQRLILWAVALAIEYISPAVRFWIPRYGASSVADWVVEGGHMAERCAGFIIIALGESIVVTGATFADLAWTTETVTAFLSAFIGALAMWWIYFHKGAEAGSEQISRSERAGPAGEARLYLSAYADRGRHHSRGGCR